MQVKVAIADDHSLFRKGIIELLSDFPEIKVLYDAPNGGELIKKIAESAERPDVCLLDINMPQMDGFTTAREIKKKWPKIRLMAVSMYDQEFTIIKMLRNGATGYVLKDIEPDELRAAIIQMHNTGFYHSETITGRLLHIAAGSEDEDAQNIINAKELQFLKYCCTDLTYKEIAEEMKLSPRTIDGYRDNLFQKLKITSRTGLAMYAIRHEIVPMF